MTSTGLDDPAPAEVLLADGTIAVIRGLRADDRAALLALHDNVSDDNYLMRFFTLGHKSGHDYTAHLFDPAGTTVMSLVATVHGEIVALATAEQMTPDTAEIAFLVADLEHGRGAGSLLLEHLAGIARHRGIRTFVAEVRYENRAMLRVFADAGLATTRTPDGNLVRVEILTARSPDADAAADRRESLSEARSLRRLLHPRGVAVVGVRRDRTGIGHAVLQSIHQGGFTGDLSLVHPVADAIDGVPAYRRFADVPQPLDLAIIAVPADRAIECMTDAAASGIRAVVVISSGFSELGQHGKDIQHSLARIARDAGIRLVGPNCLGILANDPGTSLNATFTRARPPYGGLAIGSQSGGVGISLLEAANDMNLGVHSFVSLGNKADVSGNDLLSAWFEDPTVTAAALYLESFGNARKFARIAQRFTRSKPLLVAFGGRSDGGRRAGSSHTAAVAAATVGADALLVRAGVIPCRNATQIAEVALLLSEQSLPGGRRLAVMSNAGGLGVLAADAADDCGLEVPCLSSVTQSQLAAHVSGTAGVSNPVDLGAAATAEDLEDCIGTVLSSGEVDALLIILIPTQISDPAPFLRAVASARQLHPELPILMTVTGGPDTHDLDLRGVSRFGSYDGALGALASAVRYADWLRLPEGPEPVHDTRRAIAASGFSRACIAGDRAQEWLDPAQVRILLAPYGLATSDDPPAGSAHGPGLALELVRDPVFGPVISISAGGLDGDLWHDQVFEFPPLSCARAERALRELRFWPLLTGPSGSEPGAVQGLVAAVVALGQLAIDVPDLAGLVLNPVTATRSGVVIGAAKVRLQRPESRPTDEPRQLAPTR